MNGIITKLKHQASQIILDKEREINLSLCCILAKGNLLIEDIPGVGKTSLVLTLAKLFNLKFSRVQFTNDLLPADIIGSSIYDPDQKKFTFHPGPIFTQLFLADELNRATPKTQSACLQGMEEKKVTVDGTTHPLPHPFIFIATQNPKQQIGTYPLPESQLDRFLMKIEMGYPNRDAERNLLKSHGRHELIEQLKPVMNPDDLLKLQNEVQAVHASDAVLNYILNIVAATRDSKQSLISLSPRASMGLLQAAKAWAFLRGSNMVLPEDVQAVATSVMSHRIHAGANLNGTTGTRLAEEILASIAVD